MSTSTLLPSNEISTPFPVNLDKLDILITFIFVAEFVVEYFLYYSQDGFFGYFPSISEVVVGVPNTMIFAPLMTVEAAFIAISAVFITVWAEVSQIADAKHLSAIRYVGLAFAFALSLFSDVTIKDCFTLHNTAGILVIGISILLCIIIIWKTYPGSTKKANTFRIVIAALTTISGIVSALSCPSNELLSITLHSILQIVYSLCFIMLIISFQIPIGQLKVDFVIDISTIQQS